MSQVNNFVGYLCWEPGEISQTVFVDAASPSEAVFVATHQPAPILRRPFGGTAGGKLVDEQAVLDEFLRPDVDMMLMPIIGESGTGKSHLVRWLWAHIGSNDPLRRVIYVPKQGTSLRRVLYLILEQMEGDEATALREELDQAQDLDERTAPDDLLDALARRVRIHVADLGDDHEDYRALSGLPDLLQDPFFRTHFTAEGSVIRQFVERALRGSRQGDEGEAFAFTPDDLPISLRATDASRLARDAAAVLRWPTAAQAASRVLTDLLGPALQTVFGLEGSTTLRDVMLRTRRSLKEQGAELILLIEDFTVLQGIQRDLMDALTEPPTQLGVDVLCPIRTTLAVTSGYWTTLANTVATRAKFMTHVYDLNVDLDRAAGNLVPAAGLVGRYLNAARRGRPSIEQRWDEAPASQRLDGGRWLGNACDDCRFHTECHDAFGSSPEGFGLYPFNAQALSRMVRTVSGTEYLDPRAVLGSVVRYTLEQQADDLKHGRFPSEDYGATFSNPTLQLPDLAADVRDALEAFPDPGRRATLLTFWGGVPDVVKDLDPRIHKAFQIEPTGLIPGEAPVPPPVPPIGTDAPPPTSHPLTSRGLSQIDAWASDTGAIDEEVARELRQGLLDGLIPRIDWDVVLLDKGYNASDVLTQSSFQIGGRVAGGRTPGARTWTCDIEVTTRNGAMLRGLWRSRREGGWHVAGSRAYALYCEAIDSWVDSAVEALRNDVGLIGPALGEAVVALATGGASLGLPVGSDLSPSSLLDAALHPVTTTVLQESRARGGAISRVSRMATEATRDELLKAVLAVTGARQGGGRPHALDLVDALDAFEAAANSTDGLASALLASSGVASLYAQGLGAGLAGAASSEREDLGVLHEALTALLGADRDSASLAQKLVVAVDAAVNETAFNPGHEAGQARAACDALRDLDLRVVDELGSALAESRGLSEMALLAHLARIKRQDLVRLKDSLSQLQRWLDGSLRLAAQKLTGLDASGSQGGAVEILDGLAALVSDIGVTR